MPQVVTRLSSFYVFAAVAHEVDAPLLGALTLGTVIAGVSVPLAPALVGKPLTAIDDAETLDRFGALGRSAAVFGSLAVALLLLPAALLTSGLTQVALISGMIGLPAATIVETSYWRTVFVEGRRTAALWYCGAYAAQAVLVTACLPWLSGRGIVIASFVALAIPSLALVARDRSLRLASARDWVREHHARWVPYVIGTAASVVVVQAIPIVFSAVAGFQAAAVYRAGELSFGLTNLLIGVAMQALLTQKVAAPQRTYVRIALALALVAVANGVVVRVLPDSFLRLLFGDAAPLLIAVLLWLTVQRAALAVSSVGNILMIPHVSPRLAGAFDVAAAASSLVAMLVGTVLDGLRGGLVGLAVAEVTIAVGAAYLLRRRT